MSISRWESAEDHKDWEFQGESILKSSWFKECYLVASVKGSYMKTMRVL